MIAAILWKEYHEQRLVWVALACMGALLLLGMPYIMALYGLKDPLFMRFSLCGLAILLAWLYGMICGVMLLAGEREAGTLTFLDTLPGLRRRLWLAKFLAGVVLVFAQIVFLMGVAAGARLFDNGTEAAWMLVGMAYFGLFGYAWGLLFSSFGRSVMVLVLWCFGGQVAAIVGGFFLANVVTWITMVALDFRLPDALIVGPLPWQPTAAFSFLTLPAALVGSALVFTRVDRQRRGTAEAPATDRTGKPRVSWSALFWLTWRQSAGFAVGLGVFALFLGFFILAQGVTLWPLATLLVGVLCGVTAFADEQAGPFRFLGDQRLPLGRFWLVKVGFHFAVAVAAGLIVLTPSLAVGLGKMLEVVQQQTQGRWSLFAFVFHSALLVTLIPPGLFVTMWLVYGFAAGCLYGLWLRNGLAAGVFALFTAALLTAVWVPSLLHGDLHAWQVFGPPLLLLLATRLILRPWAAGRIASWTTASRLVPIAVLVVLWIAGDLWYRVLEVPVAPAKYDLNAFEASLPKSQDNKAGELVRDACSGFNALAGQLLWDAPAPSAPPGAPPGPTYLITRAINANEHGWPADDPALGAWLDKLFAGDWVQMLKEAADLPPGMVEELRRNTAMSPAPLLNTTERIAIVLTARGLQRQAAGDDEAYVENLRLGLALSRALRTHAFDLEAATGRRVENTVVSGLDRWLEKLKGRPDLLHKALDLLTSYLEETKNASDDRALVNYLIARNSLNDPWPLVEQDLSYDQAQVGGRDSVDVPTEALWVAVSGQVVPWEQERQQRLLRLMFEGTDEQRQELYLPNGLLERSPLSMLMSLSITRPEYREAPCWEQAMQLKLALRWYQADNGKPADNLDELVPKYLKSIPIDPNSGRPFHYRLSKGEEIGWPEEPPLSGGGAAVAAAPGNPAGMPGAMPAGSMPVPGAMVPINPPLMPGADAGGAVPGAPGAMVPGNPPGMGAGAPPPPAMRKVPAGQGILWSVGQDGVDNGGHRQEGSAPGGQGEDLIFLVPLPPKEK